MADIRVDLDDLATPTEVEVVANAFAAAGFDVQAEASVTRKSVGDLPGVIYVTLGSPIAVFLTAFANEAGKDAYAAVKRWVQQLWEARAGSGNGSGSVVLKDPDATNLVLSSGIPDEAPNALRELDWGEQRGHYLVWDHSHGQWHDPMVRK